MITFIKCFYNKILQKRLKKNKMCHKHTKYDCNHMSKKKLSGIAREVMFRS
jgi:hypothetical protein